ncbi:hypothetical protein BDY17DRAFT_301364 [Neohortaea acidophila]|uniref:F-box domain-containing protein n=1 Tax=Neohortaea acidophila TaxID=245834 RepID=A0A6A6PN09_9PEZI|nr:uncharacterized protein BDY17DRAFT_301364 [Neohortaea acidophila]KAF2481449.1 hypothetical protein BDY17DRAFT_301364 [Neohortaea acidophila]
METPSVQHATSVAPSADSSAAGPYEEDSASRHFATTASQVPVPTSSNNISSNTTPLPTPPSSSTSDTSAKDARVHGTRFHEDCHETDLASPRLKSSRMFKGKGRDGVAAEVQRKKPLTLLDLPLDILKDIVKEVTHTNDLTSLALCHSALHQLTTPHIYSRFDIVWPDTNTHAEPRSGVDALTYGLATLVMAEEIFGEAPEQRLHQGNRFIPSGKGPASEMMVRRRRGNHYARYTRKFSLGNGPSDWVQEYLITKEGGKMLGTLVALAVARMRSLETFIWDMPTGILRDVWLALSSLGDCYDGRPCRLEKVWVRWHDNSALDATAPLPPPPPPLDPASMSPHSIPTTYPVLHPSLPVQIHPAALDRVEHPSFSALPPLKSLSVLDIDELAYLDEMAVLIGKSLDKLRELRIGIARHASNRLWTTVWEGESLGQIDPDYPTASSLTIGEKRLGGVLGTVTGFINDMRKAPVVLPERTKRSLPRSSSMSTTSPVRPGTSPTVGASSTAETLLQQTNDLTAGISLQDSIPEAPSSEVPVDTPTSPHFLQPIVTSGAAFENDPLVAQSSLHTSPMRTPVSEPEDVHPIRQADMLDATMAQLSVHEPDGPRLSHMLQLESLELERVPLSIHVLQKAIDWTRLTSLTLLSCQNHEQLWKTLRRVFAPLPRSPIYPCSRRTSASTPRKSVKPPYAGSDIELVYGLKLKKIHTNTVSPALISFLKDTLAPNSLEVLFLQEARSYPSSVTVDQIYKGPLRRHRNSLRKILIDSSEKGPDGLPTSSSRWKRWMLSRDVLSFICSGKMPAVRELGMAIDYRDWHFFLQHLPSIPHLRSLSMPFLADHVHGSNIDPRELALQIVDIVALRPEVELCYMGIANKCFEILESRRHSDSWDARPESHLGMHGGSIEEEDGVAGSEGEDEEEDAEGEEAGDEEVEDVDDAGVDTESDENEDDDDESESDAEGPARARGAARLRLREILFYDDKVAIFKARHGRL